MKLSKITSVPFAVAIIIVSFIVIPIGCLHSWQTYTGYHKSIQKVEETYIKDMKTNAKLTIENVVSLFDFHDAQTEKKVKYAIKAQVDSLYTMLEEFHQQNHEYTSKGKYINILKNILRGSRFRNGKGYYFAFSPDGVEQLYPPEPGLEGKNLIDLQDSKGRFLIREMIEIVKNESSGYYKYTWPEPGRSEQATSKIAYIRYFKPLNWIIGTGAYMDDVEKLVQAELLAIIEHINVQEHRNIFVLDAKDQLIAGSLPKHLKKEGDEVIRAIAGASRIPSGDYLTYPQSLRQDQVAEFLIHNRFFEKWEWTVSVALNNEKFINFISSQKKEMRHDIKMTLLAIAIIIITIISVILFLGGYFKKKVESGFNTFSSFFQKASSEYEHISTDKLQFSELVKLAGYANKMVDERHKKDRAIKRFNEQLKQANRKLKNMAEIDGLTGVANRRRFDEILQKEWLRAIRNKQQIAIGIIDIDYFKKYNDTYGHQKGDVCLKSVAKALNSSIKRSTDFLARYGGEEFVIILPDTKIDGAVKIAKMMQSAVEELDLVHESSDVSNRITFSIGLASLVPGRNSLAETLVGHADKALYQAKEEGRNRYCIYCGS